MVAEHPVWSKPRKANFHHRGNAKGPRLALHFRIPIQKEHNIETPPHILVSLDTRHEGQLILETASKIAHAYQASLTLVDVVPPMAWMTRLLMPDHEHIQQLMVDAHAWTIEGEKLLDGRTST